MHLRPFLTSAVAGLAVVSCLGAAMAAGPVQPPRYQNPGLIEPVLGQEITDKVLTLLKTAGQTCARVPAEYRVDCLRQGLRTAREEIRRRPDYAPAAKELDVAARALDKLVKDNLDRAAPRIQVAGNVLRAVTPVATPTVAAAATRVLAESATRLLRSSGTAARQAQYLQIAAAIDSTKVILRS